MPRRPKAGRRRSAPLGRLEGSSVGVATPRLLRGARDDGWALPNPLRSPQCSVSSVQASPRTSRAESQRQMPLGAVGEDGDGKEVVPDWELARSEDGPTGNAVLVPAIGALEQLAGGDEQLLEAAAARAERLTFGCFLADRLESLPCRFIGQSGDLGERENGPLWRGGSAQPSRPPERFALRWTTRVL
jgi:hypothetical protein